MIDRYKKFIFLRVPRTGSTSIVRSLFHPKHNRGIYPKTPHTPISDPCYTPYLNYLKFTFVRNPWDRVVSMYAKTDKTGSSFEEWVNQVYLEKKTIESSNISLTATALSLITINGKVVMDFIGRFEKLQEDYTNLLEKTNLKAYSKRLRKRNESKHKPYMELYNKEMVKIVRDHFEEDIEYFGYKYNE